MFRSSSSIHFRDAFLAIRSQAVFLMSSMIAFLQLVLSITESSSLLFVLKSYAPGSQYIRCISPFSLTFVYEPSTTFLQSRHLRHMTAFASDCSVRGPSIQVEVLKPWYGMTGFDPSKPNGNLFAFTQNLISGFLSLCKMTLFFAFGFRTLCQPASQLPCVQRLSSGQWHSPTERHW